VFADRSLADHDAEAAALVLSRALDFLGRVAPRRSGRV